MEMLQFQSGNIAKSIGLMGNEALWIGVFLIASGLLVDLLTIKSMRDRQVLELKPVTGATVFLFIISTLFIICGLLVMLF